jgi:Raf kinase inhibitor-like YbhB/YbcL family protein
MFLGITAALAMPIRAQNDKPVLHVTSTAFAQGEPIPVKYTCDGADISPPLKWDSAPEGVKCFALICEDPDAPGGTWIHWLAYGSSPDSRSLPEKMSKAPALKMNWFQGENDFGKIGYNGPCPPGGNAHRYFFKVYALDANIRLKTGWKKADFAEAIKGHIMAEGSLIGTYQRR